MERVNLLRSAALATLLASLAAGRASADHALTLNDAVRMALERNEDIVISRESVTIATANVRGAQGAYDPVLQLNGGWSRSQEPVNSVFSGAPLGHLGPEFTIAWLPKVLQARVGNQSLAIGQAQLDSIQSQ